MEKENDKEKELDPKLSKAKGAKKADGKRVPFREFDPVKYVETEPTIKEGKTKDNAVISFGRMNPPTSGHELLVQLYEQTHLHSFICLIHKILRKILLVTKIKFDLLRLLSVAQFKNLVREILLKLQKN